MDNARQALDVAGLPCRVAAGDNDARARVFRRDLSNDLARTLIGCARHRTGVDHHKVCIIGFDRHAAAGEQLRLDFDRVGLVDAAAEGHDGVLHESGLRAEG